MTESDNMSHKLIGVAKVRDLCVRAIGELDPLVNHLNARIRDLGVA